MVVLVVLDGRVLDLDPEAGEQLVEVVAVLVLLGLAEDDQPAAGADEGLDRVDLVGRAAGRAAVGGRLPLRVGGVGDDEHGGAGEDLGGERAGGVGGDLELALGERGGAARRRSRRGGRAGSRSATSGRIVHASEWASSKRTRAVLRRAAGMTLPTVEGRPDRVNGDFGA